MIHIIKRGMASACLLGLVALVPSTAGQVSPDLLSARNTEATVNVEHAWASDIDHPAFGGESSYESGWVYASIPGVRLFGFNVYTALEADVINRNLWQANRALLNDKPMQRYGIFTGITLFKGNNHRGSFLAGSGLATDFHHLGRHSWYLHLIYDHRFTLSDRFALGLGVLVSYNLGTWKWPLNLLPSLTWQITPKTLLKAAWDSLVLEQWLFARTSLFAELRYDLSFFGLAENTRYELESVSAGAGVNVRIADNFFVRVRYLEMLSRNERIGTLDGAMDEYRGRGRMVGMSLLYAR